MSTTPTSRAGIVRGLGLVLLFALLLFLPWLDRAALVDPVETSRAEALLAIARGGSTHRASLPVLLGALGVSILGESVFAARALIALVAALGIALAYLAGARLASARAGSLAAIALSIAPLYLLEGRTLAGDVATAAALLLALAGFAGFLVEGKIFDLVLGTGGIALASYGGGVLQCGIAPVLALAIAPSVPRRRALLASLAAAIAVLLVAPHASLFGAELPETLAPGAPGFEAALLAAVSGLFPAAALLPFAFLEESLALPFAVLVALAHALQVRLTGTWQPPAAIGVLAVLAGITMDRLLEDPRPRRFGALVAAGGVIALWSGFAVAPRELAGPHLGLIEWPESLKLGTPVLLASLAAAAAFGAALLGWKRGIMLGLAAGALVALYDLHVLAPAAHEALSIAPQLRASRGRDRLAVFHTGKRAIAFQRGAPVIELEDPSAAFDALLLPREELGVLDRRLGDYALISKPEAPLLLLTRALRAGEHDENPLRRAVFRPPQAPPAPEHAAAADWGSVELIGWDAPEAIAVDRGPLHLELHFRVKSKPPPQEHVFLSLESRLNRFGDDAVPVFGLYPTEAWEPGEQVLDEHTLEIADSEPGEYTIFLGFVAGGDRLAPLPGANVEPAETRRVRLGSVRFLEGG